MKVHPKVKKEVQAKKKYTIFICMRQEFIATGQILYQARSVIHIMKELNVANQEIMQDQQRSKEVDICWDVLPKPKDLPLKVYSLNHILSYLSSL